MSRRLIRPTLGVLALAASSFAVSAPATVSAATTPSPAVAECAPDAASAASAARVRDDAKDTAKEPELYSKNEAKAYGVIKDHPTMAPGSVTIPTIFHVVSKTNLDPAGKARMNTMIAAQMQVLNDSYSGKTAPDAADSPFRFDLTKTTWTTNPVWNTVTPGKTERDMKKALYEGDSRTLNVYVADIGDGLLGWAYFPKGYNNGRDFMDHTQDSCMNMFTPGQVDRMSDARLEFRA